MTLRPATPADLPALSAFLRAREEGSMFLLAAIEAGAVLWPGAAPSADPHAMRLWWDGRAVVGLTPGGTLVAQCAGGVPDGLGGALAGAGVAILLAPDGQVPRLIEALGLGDAHLRHHDEEPGFRLTLADLIAPPAQGLTIRPLTDADRPLLHVWRAAYLAEVFAAPPAEAEVKARQDVGGWLARGSHRLAERSGRPVALSGFNAMLAEAVQVGAVYTPPALRGQGLARGIVAAHLAEVRARGVRRACLFAANEAAARAYAAIGFRRSGTMGIAQFAAPQRIGTARAGGVAAPCP